MTASAKVPRSEWLTALKPFLKTKAPKRGESGDVLLTLEDGQMVFRYGGVETAAEAEGNWPGAATIQWANLYGVAKVPPLKDPVAVEVNGDRLKIENVSFACRWSPKEAGRPPAFANNPPTPKRGQGDRTFAMLVSLGIDQTDAQIASLDLTAQVQQARREKERLIGEAADILAPLEITAADLSLLVNKTLGYKTKR